MVNVRTCVFLLLCVQSNAADDLVVRTTYGLINGTIEKTRYGQDILAFYRIPYAQPPIGDLRLKPPVEALSWNGIRDCTQLPSECVQPSLLGIISPPWIGQEDCLYLNVFVHKLPSNETDRKLPVMVFIHGGAFQTSTGNKYKGNYLLDQPIIYVSLNYRLGPLGFLGLGVEEFSGNFGLKDQLMALKWVKNNIASFGGNPNDITLFGQSAGSMCVHLQMFNPAAKGLFNKAILQSGTAFSLMSHYDREYGRALSTGFAVATGCYSPKPYQVLRCLQKLSPEDFVDAESRLFAWNNDPIALFKPMVEGENITGAALPKRPNEGTYQINGIPLIVGVNSGETIFRVLSYLNDDGKLIKEINENYRRLLPLISQIIFNNDHDRMDDIADKMKEFYFGKDKIGLETAVQTINMFTDFLFVYPAMETLLHYNGTKYWYLYDHKTKCSISKELGCYKKEYGVDHGEEVPHLFVKSSLPFENMTSVEKRISNELVKFWTNFAIYGDPNGNAIEKIWTPTQTADLKYLHITTNSSNMEKNAYTDRYNFWNNLPLRPRWTRSPA